MADCRIVQAIAYANCFDYVADGKHDKAVDYYFEANPLFRLFVAKASPEQINIELQWFERLNNLLDGRLECTSS